MARLSDETKELILADFHTGMSQNKLAKKYKVSPATINKLCKGLSPKFKEKVNTVSSINAELSKESEYQSECFYKAVEERTKHLIFFQNSALKNQRLANKFLEESESLTEVESHARITAKNKETVLGKQADTQIQINNQNNQITGITRKIIGIDD